MIEIVKLKYITVNYDRNTSVNSLIEGSVHSARGLLGDETVVDILTTEEFSCELWGSGEELGGHVHLGGHGSTIVHVAGLVEGVSNFEGMLGVLNFLLLCWELLGLHILLLDLAHVLLDFAVNGHIKLSILTHLVKRGVLECSHTVFQS